MLSYMLNPVELQKVVGILEDKFPLPKCSFHHDSQKREPIHGTTCMCIRNAHQMFLGKYTVRL